MHSQKSLSVPLEADRPSVVAEAEVFGGRIALQVSGHRLGHDEGEDASLASVVQLAEPVQKRHSRIHSMLTCLTGQDLFCSLLCCCSSRLAGCLASADEPAGCGGGKRNSDRA